MELPLTEQAVLTRYLDVAHDALLWKLEGLSEYDMRRPLTPTGTNLLGLVKHVAFVELGYFGPVFDRPALEVPHDQDDPNSDMYALASESVDDVLGWFNAARTQAIAAIEELPLDTHGHVPWWGESNPVTLSQIAVHMVAELHRHCGQADILREQLDGAVGMRPGSENIPDTPADYWSEHCARLEEIAASVAE